MRHAASSPEQPAPPRLLRRSGVRLLRSLASAVLAVVLALPSSAPRPLAEASVLPAAPPSPAPISPDDRATLDNFGPTLRWNNPAGATQIHLQVIPANFDGVGIDVLLGTPATSYDIPPPPQWYGLLPGMSYTWRVRVSNAAAAVPLDDPSWSPWAERTFRTPVVPASVINPLSPPNGGTAGTLTPVIQWSVGRPDLFYYEFQLSRDPVFTTDPAAATAMVYEALLHGGVTNPPNSYTVPKEFPLEPNAVYYWRVRPRVQGDGTPVAWGPSFRFATEQRGGITMYVVDQPSKAGEFSALGDAVEAACNAAGSGAARVEVRTARGLTAAGLGVGCDLTLEATQGRGQIGGGMAVNAAGAFALVNFAVSGPAVFNANRHLALQRNAFDSPAAINFGAVAGAPFPAGGRPRMTLQDFDPTQGFGGNLSAAGGATITDNEGSTSLDVTWTTSVTQRFTYEFSNNKFPQIGIRSDTAVFGAGAINLRSNPTKDLSLTLNVGGSAECKIENHSALDRLAKDITLGINGQFTCTEAFNAALDARLNVGGDGQFFLRAQGSQYGTYDGRFTAKEVNLDMVNTHWKGNAELGFLKGTTRVSAQISGSSEDRMVLVAAAGGTFSFPRRVEVEPGDTAPRVAAAAPSQTLVIENLRLLPRATPDMQPRLMVGGFDQTNVSEVIIRNNTIVADSPFALDVSEVNVPVTIADNTITRGGIYLYGDVEGGRGGSSGPLSAPYTLRGNTVRVSELGAAALSVSDLLNVTATGNTFAGAPFPAMDGTQAVLLARNAYVRFTRGNTITGTVNLNEGSFARFEGNTFTGAYISDLTFGRLVNDPVKANAGLDPNQSIVTKVDFDGNGCADYPTGFNQKLGGACAMDGVPPPTPPLP